MSGGSIQVDTSGWPIVIHTVVGELSNAQLDAYAAEGSAVLQRRQPFVTVVDTRRMGKFSAYARARNSAWQKEHHAELAAYCLGTAYVISSPLLRFVAMTVLLLGQLPTPYLVCDSLEEALRWATEKLDGQQPPAP